MVIRSNAYARRIIANSVMDNVAFCRLYKYPADKPIVADHEIIEHSN